MLDLLTMTFIVRKLIEVTIEKLQQVRKPKF